MTTDFIFYLCPIIFVSNHSCCFDSSLNLGSCRIVLSFCVSPVGDLNLVRKMSRIQRAWVLASLVIALALSDNEVANAEQLVHSYYKKSCSNVEKAIFRDLKKAFLKDKTTAPGILRLIFLDCFVRGCDASVLLAGPGTERTPATNKGLHGFEAVDGIKAAVEEACPNTVS